MHSPGHGMGRQAGSMEAPAGSMGAPAGRYYQQPPQAQGRGSGSSSGSGSQHYRMQGETIRLPAMVDCHVDSLGGHRLLASKYGCGAALLLHRCCTLWLTPHVLWGGHVGGHMGVPQSGRPA